MLPKIENVIIALDMDNTLLNCLPHQENMLNDHVYIREGAHQFLDSLFDLDVVVGIYTAADKLYTFEMLERCFPTQIVRFHFIITKEQYLDKYMNKSTNVIFEILAQSSQPSFVTTLNQYNSTVILIDDLPTNSMNTMYNLRIIIEPFYGGHNRTESTNQQPAVYYFDEIEKNLWTSRNVLQLKNYFDNQYPFPHGNTYIAFNLSSIIILVKSLSNKTYWPSILRYSSSI